MILTIPDIRQRDDYDCGWACTDAILRFYGQRERGPAELANRVQGMAAETVEAVFRSLNFRLMSGTMDVDTIRDLTRRGRPVMCAITLNGESHWVVAAGVERGKVHYQDPWHGPLRASAEWFTERWKHPKWDEYKRWAICPEKP